MPYHFKEAPSNMLTNDAMDPTTEMPELKVCAVNIVPLPKNQSPCPSSITTDIEDWVIQ
jgi:predicted molibdopterin-dependent oxidoreductase YjgC